MDFTKDTRRHILVTGGAGYIGSHTLVCLLEAGFNVVVVDNLINSNAESLNRVRQITGCEPSRIRFYEQDLCDAVGLERVFSESPQFEACIHFAGLKAVGESVVKPIEYYRNNLDSTIILLNLMKKYNCKSIVFSSSATVYGAAPVPITEESQAGIGITNAYGRTKYFIEQILEDFYQSTVIAGDNWNILVLRYFNPVGAHPSGLIGEDPNGPPNNLMPYVSQVAIGRREKLTIFGNDYSTHDGTGVRDFLHVMDAADGHVAALNFLNPVAAGRGADSPSGFGQYSVINLGTGRGCSVLEMVDAMKRASGKPIPYEIGPRRAGDIDVCYAETSKSLRLLGWSAKRNLDEMCIDLWNWQSKNPNGYASC